MGKANRVKAERATKALSAPARKKANKGMPTWVGTLIIAAVLALLVIFVTLSIMSSRGTFKRMYVIAETENFKVTVPMMSYMIYSEYQNTVSIYEQFSSQYNTTIAIPAADSTGTSLDTSVSLREQVYQVKTDEDGNQTTITWFDHFAELAKSDLEKILACCEYARRDGIELDKSEKEAIAVSIDNMTLYAEYYGYTTSGYISAMYGQGVSKKDVRKMMELSQLATKYNTVMSEKFMDEVSDEQVEKEYSDNKEDYDIYIDYIGYTFKASFSPATSSDNADTLNAQRKEKYEKLQDAYKAAVVRLAGCTIENFESVLKEELTKVFELEDALEKGSELTADEKAEAALRAEEEAKAAVVENYLTTNESFVTEINTWMKSTDDPRKAGDVKKVVKEYDTNGNALDADREPTAANPSTKPASATSTYAVYMTTSALHRDSGYVRSVAHILFKTDTFKNVTDTSKLSAPLKTLADRVVASGNKITAESVAKEMLAMMKEDGKISEQKAADGTVYYTMDESVFEAYGQTYTEDSSVLYDNVTQGQMVAAFEDWMFDSARKEGEITYPEAVLTDYGYHIMMYRGDEKEAWSHSIRVSLAEGKYDDLLEAAMEEFAVSYDSRGKVWNMISG